MALLKLKKESENPEVAALQEEIERLKAAERIRLKYGRVSDKDVERLIEEESNAAKRAEQKRINEEASRKAKEERDRKIRCQVPAGELVSWLRSMVLY